MTIESSLVISIYLGKRMTKPVGANAKGRDKASPTRPCDSELVARDNLRWLWTTARQPTPIGFHPSIPENHLAQENRTVLPDRSARQYDD
jgi:hypothetical protein